MTPQLRPGSYVIATGMFRDICPNDIVVIQHDSLEKIKRVTVVREGAVFLKGDNPEESTDSRQFGWVNRNQILAKVLYPR